MISLVSSLFKAFVGKEAIICIEHVSVSFDGRDFSSMTNVGLFQRQVFDLCVYDAGFKRHSRRSSDIDCVRWIKSLP